MPKATPIQQSFNAGELSPLMTARTDYERYNAGVATLINYVPLLQGPATRRPGTHYVAPVKDSSKKTRLVRFEFSTTQAYIIEMGDQYMRFYKDNGAIVEAAVAITGATKANPGVITAVGHGYNNGDEVYISGVGGMTQLNGNRYIVANKTANTFELSGTNTTTYGTYTSGGSAYRIYTITTPYLEADLFKIKFAQSADVLYITHPSYAFRKLSRTGHTSWTLSTVSLLDGPYTSINSTATTMVGSAGTGSITITASAITGINNDTGFQTTDIGRLIRINNAGNWAWGNITARASTTSVTLTVVGGTFPTVATADWRMSIYGDDLTMWGHPACVTFYEDRLCLAGSAGNPARIDMSESSLYESFSPTETNATVIDSNAVRATLNSSDVQRIRWLASSEHGLVAGTVSGEWLVRPSAQNEALTPTNSKGAQSNDQGSADIQPVKANKTILFVQRSGKKVRAVKYAYEEDGLATPDATRLAPHITGTGLVEVAYQKEPQSIVWCVRSDGILAGLTYDPAENVTGWHQHIIGGYSNAGHTADALVESVACIPSVDGTRDELWLIVKRYINGATKKYVEYIGDLWKDTDAIEDAFFVDSGLTYSGAPTTTITGLQHLEGETVSVLADGAVHPDVVVTNGAITLNKSTSKAQVGLAYQSDLETLPIEAGAADGTAQGKTKRIHRVFLRLLNTVGMKVAPSVDYLDVNPIVFRVTSDPMSAPVPLFTGDKTIEFDSDYETQGRIYIRQDQPTPGTILAIIPQLVTQD